MTTKCSCTFQSEQLLQLHSHPHVLAHVLAHTGREEVLQYIAGEGVGTQQDTVALKKEGDTVEIIWIEYVKPSTVSSN